MGTLFLKGDVFILFTASTWQTNLSFSFFFFCKLIIVSFINGAGVRLIYDSVLMSEALVGKAMLGIH